MPEPLKEAEGFAWIRKNWLMLPPDVWVAVNGHGPVAKGDNCEQLREQLKYSPNLPEPVVIVVRHDGKTLGEPS